MIVCHKPYYNPNYTNPNKKSPSGICPKPKKLYEIYILYKLYNTKKKRNKKI